MNVHAPPEFAAFAGYPVGESIDRPVSVQFAQATPSATTSVNEKDAIHKVLSGYYDAFGRDSVASSAFYGEPTLIVLPNEVIMLNSRVDVAAFFLRSLWQILSPVDIHIRNWVTIASNCSIRQPNRAENGKTQNKQMFSAIPIRQILPTCCARAVSGHAAAAPPSSVTNERR